MGPRRFKKAQGSPFPRPPHVTIPKYVGKLVQVSNVLWNCHVWRPRERTSLGLFEPARTHWTSGPEGERLSRVTRALLPGGSLEPRYHSESWALFDDSRKAL